MGSFRLRLDEIEALSALHCVCFGAEAWSREQLLASLESASVEGWGVRFDNEIVGIVLVQRSGDDREILTLAVDPVRRRQGMARGLLSFVRNRHPDASFFLEVAEDNQAARTLYESCGYRLMGRRKAYYRRVGGSVDALIYRLDTNS